MEEDDDFFGLTQETHLIKDKYILSPKYIPNRIIARDTQMEEVKKLVKPVLSNGEPYNAIIFGKTGTGKTVVSRYVMKKLEESIENKPEINVKTVYINCKKSNAETHILREVLLNIDKDTNIPKTGLTKGYYYDSLWNKLNENNLSLIVIMDEIEYLQDDNIIYNFSRAGGGNDLEGRLFVGVVGLTNDTAYFDGIDPRILSSMGEKRIVFPPYNAEELQEIMEDRKNDAFYDDVLDDMVIPLCASKSAQHHGDARRALELLLNAAIVAEEENSPVVREEHVHRGDEKLNLDHISEIINTLPLHSKLVLLSVIKLYNAKKYSITSGEVMDAYNKLANHINIDGLSKSRISELISELDMLGLVDAPLYSRGRGGRTRKISAVKNVIRLSNELYKDYNLEPLKHLNFKTSSQSIFFGQTTNR